MQIRTLVLKNMKLLLTIFFVSISYYTMAQTNISANDKAILIKNKIEQDNVTEIEITYRKRIFKVRELYTKWSFPGGNFIKVDGRLYNLDYLQYFETIVFNAGFKNETTTLILNLDKIR